MTPDEGGFQHAGGKGVAAVLRHQSEMPRDFPAGQIVDGAVPEPDFATLAGAQAGQGVKEGGLAGPVLAQDAPALTRMDLQIQPAAKDPIADAQLQVAGSEHGLRHGRRLPRCNRYRNTGTPSRAVMTPTGSCCGASRVRARVSASTSRLPPARAAAGSSSR